jgi:hypothetical protein
MAIVDALLAYLRTTAPPVLLTRAEIGRLTGAPLPPEARGVDFWHESALAQQLRAAGYLGIPGPEGLRVLFAQLGRGAV